MPAYRCSTGHVVPGSPSGTVTAKRRGTTVERYAAEVPDSSWRKSSASNATGDCVEVAMANNSALVRNSRNKHGEILAFPPFTWNRFLRSARADHYTPPACRG
ncbi:DUF397 domain-containing protein [Umezawaea tangerina]|uniref:DUF397 domain-containing protein n=1 Tax=Umezawaea tangerina TaxID=84725 RepID=UPI003CCBC1AF